MEIYRGRGQSALKRPEAAAAIHIEREKPRSQIASRRHFSVVHYTIRSVHYINVAFITLYMSFITKKCRSLHYTCRSLHIFNAVFHVKKAN